MKIIRLTESDLTNIVKRVISENDSMLEKKYKTYSKLLNKLTETFDWVSKIDVKLSSTEAAGGWRDEESKPLLIVSVYFKNYQKIRMMTQFELFDEISFIHDMFFPHLTGDPLIYSDNVTTYLSVKSVFPNGKTGFFPIQIVSGDYDDVSQISESQLTNIVKRAISENDSMLEKNKKFLKNKLGIDFTNGIQQVTSTYDVPMEFDNGIGSDSIRRYLNNFGPMYLFELDGIKYLYQDRGFEFFIDEDGFDYVDGEIPEMLGIDEMGLRFSNIIDLYFKEEEL
jgi:DNA-binding transcriptional regulator GbsR (MarR family)